MNMILIYFLIIIIIPPILLSLSIILFKKKNNSLQMNLPFECGFNPTKSSRNPFSLQFFLLGILFLIFDVEITLLLPIPINLPTLSSIMKTLTIFSFIIALLLGVLIEWYFKTLDWIK